MGCRPGRGHAAKYSPEGGTIRVSIVRANNAVRVEVADNGPGIPDEFRKMIFGKFAQADQSSTRNREGTGLGLSIAKAIVESHGGAIDLETETGAGTRFYFDLPEWRGSEKTIPQDNEPMQVGDINTASDEKPRILHVEDDPDVTEVIGAAIGASAELEFSGTLKEAREKLKNGTYDLLLLDIGLPDGIGLDLLDDLDPATPVVLFTARDVPRHVAGKVAAVLIKSRTSMDKLSKTLSLVIQNKAA